MRFALTLLVWALVSCSLADAADAVAVRQKLAQAILSEGPEQQKLLSELADSGSKIVADVLNAWVRDGVYIYSPPEAPKVPVLLEEAQDANGKARALRID